MLPLTPCSAETLTLPSCRLAHAELLHTLAPLAVSISLLEMSPLTSARTPPSSFCRSAIFTSVRGSE